LLLVFYEFFPFFISCSCNYFILFFLNLIHIFIIYFRI
jgi:hypothetical protein